MGRGDGLEGASKSQTDELQRAAAVSNSMEGVVQLSGRWSTHGGGEGGLHKKGRRFDASLLSSNLCRRSHIHCGVEGYSGALNLPLAAPGHGKRMKSGVDEWE